MMLVVANFIRGYPMHKQSRIYKDGSRTRDFLSVYVEHKQGCPTQKNDGGWGSYSCDCGTKWLLEQEIKINQNWINKHQEAIDTLSELLEEQQ